MSAMHPRHCIVRRVHRETRDVFTLELEPVDSDRFSFRPGQFTMLYVFGIGEVPISISGDPADDVRLVQTIRAIGAVTGSLDKLGKGNVVGVRGPFGTCWPVTGAVGKDVVLVAGGIGLAPLRPVLYRLLAEREKFGKVILLYGTRTPEDIVFRQELEQWRVRMDAEVQVTVDRAGAEWRGNVGVVTTLLPRAEFDPVNAVAMLCGPEVMMRFVAADLMKRGLPAEAIHLSLERNMKCGVGFCGHCQCGPFFVCKDGPIFRYDMVRRLLSVREV
jgi:NAD(P)H-flavin reductase